mmetsp:Transcript_2569/g.5497  ORF Transcript_2569/g.5497 Transcript_2569/m.5497 type:complete len:158 (-) Transcript_2569:13-486(-)
MESFKEGSGFKFGAIADMDKDKPQERDLTHRELPREESVQERSGLNRESSNVSALADEKPRRDGEDAAVVKPSLADGNALGLESLPSEADVAGVIDSRKLSMPSKAANGVGGRYSRTRRPIARTTSGRDRFAIRFKVCKCCVDDEAAAFAHADSINQ